MNGESKNVAETVTELMTRLGVVQVVELEDHERKIPVLGVPTKDGISIMSIKRYLDEFRYDEKPQRLIGTATHEELASFIAHVNRFSDPKSAVYGKRESCSLLAVFDYHQAFGDPRFCAHKATYEAPKSEQWIKWTRVDGQEMDQSDFADLIEDRIADLGMAEDSDDDEEFKAVEFLEERLHTKCASPANLLELAGGLSVTVEQTVASHVKPSTGEAVITYVEQHKDTVVNQQRVTVPTLFLLHIPIFRGGELHLVPARIRYRVRNGEISWHIQLYRTDLILDQAFKKICDRVMTETKLPLFRGSPESR